MMWRMELPTSGEVERSPDWWHLSRNPWRSLSVLRRAGGQTSQWRPHSNALRQESSVLTFHTHLAAVWLLCGEQIEEDISGDRTVSYQASGKRMVDVLVRPWSGGDKLMTPFGGQNKSHRWEERLDREGSRRNHHMNSDALSWDRRAEGVEREMGSERVEAEEERSCSPGLESPHLRRLVGRPPLLLTCWEHHTELNLMLRIWCFFSPITFFPAFLLPHPSLPPAISNRGIPSLLRYKVMNISINSCSSVPGLIGRSQSVQVHISKQPRQSVPPQSLWVRNYFEKWYLNSQRSVPLEDSRKIKRIVV